jgi:hypothetical protein
MSETSESGPKVFTAENMDDLLIGLGEMIGMDDQHVRMLLESLPEISLPFVICEVSPSPQEQEKGLFHCLEMTYGGQTYRVASKIEKGQVFIGEVRSADGKTTAYMRFVPENITGREADERTRLIDKEWN